MMKNLALTLLLAWSASADRMPTVSFSLNHKKLGSSPSPENVSGDCKVVSQVTDKFIIGSTLSVGGDATDLPIRNVFTKLSDRVSGRGVSADLAWGVKEKTVTGVIKVDDTGSTGGAVYTATVNSAHKGKPFTLPLPFGAGTGKASATAAGIPFVEKLRIKSSGAGWSVTPTIHTQDFKVDLEAATMLGKDTSCQVSMVDGGSSHVTVNHDIDEDTHLTLNSGSGLADLEVSVQRRVGNRDIFTPTFRAASKDFRLAWRHALGPNGEQSVTTTVDQADETVQLEFSGSEDSDWTAKLSAPIKSPKDVDVSFGRKFSVRSLASLNPAASLLGKSAQN